MPVAPTYPGVYIEELPSGVHTITGVSTSIAAFIGFTAKGAVDEAVHIFSFADFERSFGGLSVDSPLSYCVKHFFQNGGTEAYVVRVAQGAAEASVTLGNGNAMLVVNAISPGVWGNALRIDVDYDTVNPSSQFNVRVVEFVERNGDLVPGPTEVYRNLTMNSADPNFVVDTINAGSQLIRVALPAGLTVTGTATSQSGPIRDADLAQLDLQHNTVAFTLNGQGPYEVALTVPAIALPLPVTLAQFQTALDNVAANIAKKINDKVGGTPVTGARAGAAILITAVANADRASVRFLNAGTSNASKILKLGLANGGVEIDAASSFRPSSGGTTGVPALPSSVSGANPGALGAGVTGLRVSLNGGPPVDITLDAAAASVPEEIAAKINAAAGDTLVIGRAVGNTYSIASADWAKCWSIRITSAAANNAAVALKLGAANGGTETLPASSSTLADADVQGFYATAIARLRQLHLSVSLNGQPPFDVDLTALAAPPALPWAAADTLTARQNIATAIANSINTHFGLAAGTAVTGRANPLGIVSSDPTRWSAIHITSTALDDAAAPLKLGLANGGVEDSLTIDVMNGASATSLHTVRLPLWAYWGTPKGTPQPRSLDDVAGDIDEALKSLGNNDPYLAGASAQRIGNTIRVLPGSSAPNDPNTVFDFSNTSALTLAAFGFTAAGRNVARYAPGIGITAFGQTAGNSGSDGAAPSASELTGNQLAKTGLYALEDVDIFNLLVMPDATAAGGMMGVLTEAIAYCVKRRAFMIIDAPEQISTFAQAQAWIGGPASPLRSRNDALYFPRLREPDPMMNGTVRTFPSAGAMAGIYARTDAERGVWKAPAGTMATVWGATGLSYTLTDGENGTLNPRGLNCLRTFPIFGTVSWGARTGNGADAMADEYKYVPVRRLALFLEESLYRGSQWAVFEPNDEPLWAQLRLNIGAFMHTLFAQGAFQGQTPRDAYFVKCDKETTTQNDVDLGRVNIVVGFAPLKPAEFVIVQIQQIAGTIRT
jgi:phage tail sheath protein FI